MIARRFSALAVLALLGLSACNSTPQTSTVAREIIETLPVSDEVKACMETQLDGYTNDELEDIGDENDDFSSMDPNAEGITPELRQFIDDLATCVDGTAPTGTQTDATAAEATTTDGTEPDATAVASTAGGG